MAIPPRDLSGVSSGTTTVWPVGLLDTFGDLGERAAVDRRHARVDEGALGELTRHQADAAGAEDVGRVVPAPRLHVGDDRRRGRDAIEVVDREVDAELACDRDEMEDAVRRAARAGDRRGRVLDRTLRDHLRRTQVAAHDVDGELADLEGRLRLRAVHRRDAVRPEWAQTEEVDHRGHRVGGELASTRSGCGAGHRLELVELLGAHLPGGVRADRLVDVADRDLATAVQPRRDGARVEDDGGDVEAAERHDRPGCRLVAGDEANEAVEEVTARHELDRVGDDLA